MPVPFVPNPTLMPGYAATGFAAPNVAGAAGSGAAGLSALNIVGIGLMAGSLIYSIIKGPTKVEGPRLDDFQVNDSSYDIVITLLYGKGRLSGNIIWPADNSHTSINLIREAKKTYKKGGFLGIGGVKITEYTYFGTFAISFCESPSNSVLKIWGGDRVIYDVTDDASDEDAAYSRQLITDGKIRIYLGGASQIPDSLMEQREGTGNVPAYKDVVSSVFNDIPLADFDNQIPQVTALIVNSTNIASQSWNQISASLINSNWFKANRTHLEIVYHKNNWQLLGRLDIGAEQIVMPLLSKNGVSWQSENHWNLWPQGNHTLSNTFAACSYNNALFAFGNGTDWVYVSPGSHRWGEIHRRTSGGITSTIRFTLRDPSAIAFNPGTLYGNLIWIFEGNSFWSTSDAGLQVNKSGDYSGGMLFTLRNADAGIGTRSFPSLISHNSNLYLIGGEETGGSLRHNGMWRINLNVNPPTFTSINTEITALGTAGYRVHRAISYTPIGSTTARLAALAKRISNSKYYIFESTDNGVSWKVAYSQSWAVTGYSNSGGNTLIQVSGDKTAYAVADRIIQISGSAAGDEIYTIISSSYNAGTNKTTVTVAGTINPNGATLYLYQFDLLDASEFSPSRLPAFAYINGSFFVYGGYNADGYGNKAFMTRESNAASDSTSVADVVTDICERAGLSASDIDVTDLEDDTLHGYIIKEQSSAWSLIEPLRQAFFFDVVESDGKIKFVKRGGASVATLTSTDLGARKNGAEPIDLIQIERAHDLELPKRIDVSYYDVDREYEPSTQTYQLNESNSRDAYNLRLPIAMTSAKAAQIAEVAMYEFWSSRSTISFSTTNKFDYLEPTDVVTINETDLDGNVSASRVVRLIEKDSEGGLIQWKAVQEKSEIYAPVASGTSAAQNSSNFLAAPATLLKVFQHPILDMAHNDFGVSVACGSSDSRWPGATIEMSTDGENFEPVEDISQEGTFGIVLSPVGAPTNYLDWDRRNVIDVDLMCGELSSATEAEVRSGKNLFYYGDEMLGAATVTALGSNRYRLSNLIRGLYGTEWAIESHRAGESIVLMQDLVRIPLDASFNQKILYFRAQTFGDNRYVESSITVDDVALKPFAPVHVIATRFSEAKIINGRTYAVGSWKIEWMRRSRSVSNWNAMPIPLNEEREEYEIEFISNVDGATVLHYQEIAALDLRPDQKAFFILPVTAFTYYDAEGIQQTQCGQNEIYGEIADAISVRIYQISKAVGKGYPAEQTFTA